MYIEVMKSNLQLDLWVSQRHLLGPSSAPSARPLPFPIRKDSTYSSSDEPCVLELRAVCIIYSYARVCPFHVLHRIFAAGVFSISGDAGTATLEPLHDLKLYTNSVLGGYFVESY